MADNWFDLPVLIRRSLRLHHTTGFHIPFAINAAGEIRAGGENILSVYFDFRMNNFHPERGVQVTRVLPKALKSVGLIAWAGFFLMFKPLGNGVSTVNQYARSIYYFRVFFRNSL